MVKYNVSSGDKFNRFTAIRKSDNVYNGKTMWVFRCDCGKEKELLPSTVAGGRVKSCGCLCSENMKKLSTKYENEYLLDETTVTIIVKNKKFLIDRDDYDEVSKKHWSVNPDGYLISSDRILLHRFLLNPSKTELVDHIDRDRSNNTRSNLRICNKSQNSMNRTAPSNSKTGHTGVSIRDKSGKYRAYITCNGKQKNLGTYLDINDAIRARKNAEKKYFMDFRPIEE